MEFKLRPWRIEDLEDVARAADNPRIRANMSDEFPDSAEKWAKFLAAVVDNERILYRAVEIDGRVGGAIGIGPQTGVHRRNAELGYWLAEEFWGRGIITAAIREIVALGFAAFDIDRIFARPFESNAGSHRALEKAGFRLEARFEKTIVKDGALLDELVYAVRRPAKPERNERSGE
ncbi:MAG: GNAT family N-acetyltransferase [Acidobacteria bacterium]|nr:GNAT family N-acetyltransferase [Acidobacteriota bacterium]